MNLSHFSDTPIAEVLSAKQAWRDGRASAYEKPKGLWLSVDGEEGWDLWCSENSFGLGKLRHRVTLTPNANILLCSRAVDLDNLTEKYGITVEYTASLRDVAVDWGSVAADYQGIIIAPYVWSRRLHDRYSWYYGWDCASGCIWDGDAVALIELVKDTE